MEFPKGIRVGSMVYVLHTLNEDKLKVLKGPTKVNSISITERGIWYNINNCTSGLGIETIFLSVDEAVAEFLKPMETK